MNGERAALELRPSTRLGVLFPGIYEQRDRGLETPGSFAALRSVFGGALDELYDAIHGLWDDHFVERAAPAALPLLAELFRARFITADPRVQRALLARIVGWRRRKGTLGTLEEVLSLTSSWDVEVDEGFRSLLVTQQLGSLAPWRGRTAVLWDPIGVSDPLSRRALDAHRLRSDEPRARTAVIARGPSEELDAAVRRLGRVDAGRHAASPRTLDLRGWARPDAVVLRASRLHPVELEDVVATAAPVVLPHAQRGYTIDPLGRALPLVWLEPLRGADDIALVTARHEPAPAAAPDRRAARLLTPTTLAADPDAVEATGAIAVQVHGIPLVGLARTAAAIGPLAYAPVGDRPVLRLAEDARPTPGDRWRIELVATIAEADEPSLDDRVASRAELTATGPEQVESLLGTTELGGRAVDLVITRLAGRARVRAADGTWSDLDVAPPLGAGTSNAVALALGASVWIARIERDLAAGTNRLVAFERAPGATWSVRGALPTPLETATGMAAIAVGTSMLVVAATPAGLGLWRITNVATTPTVERIDDASPAAPRPQPRRSPQLALHAGRLYVHGGDIDGAAAGDVWSIAPAGGAWRAHAVRRQQERMGAQLLSTPQGLVLIGGDEVPGAMRETVHVWDPATGKAWRPLPSLPIEPALPGCAFARVTAAGALEVIAWADRTRSRLLTLAPGAETWTMGTLETAGGCAPPEAGEAVLVGDELLVIAPPPLPASDVVIVLGGRGHLARLPRLDLANGSSLRLRVGSDGGTYERARRGPGAVARPQPLDSRFGGAFASANAMAPGGVRRFAAPGRLARRPWRLAQRSLERWAELAPPPDDAAVLLDPRLGRIVLPVSTPDGPVTTSAFVGRPAPIGVGCVPPDGVQPVAWDEPDVAAWAAIDARALPTAYLDPARAGATLASGGERVAIVGDLAAAVVHGTGRSRIAIVGSATVPPARLSVGVDRDLEVWAADPGTAPRFDIDPERGVSLALHVDETTAPERVPRPSPRIALAGVWLPGRLELDVASGRIDLRFCHLGQPGSVAIAMPGAGHQDATARWSVPEPEVELRLYGCVVGAIELPPWVKLVAAGCTFDAGSREQLALRAAGAHVRLRHCTIYGGVAAGRVELSSCVVAGAVDADRTDVGFVRHSLIGRGGRPPRLHASFVHTASFISARPTDPTYLVLADNNGPLLHAGEDGALPGAYAERGDHVRELEARTSDFLPIAMAPVHVDRTTHDLYRLDHP